MHNYYDAMAPIDTTDGKTIWYKVGVGFPAEDSKYAMKVIISTIPIGLNGPLEIFLFEKESKNKNNSF